MRVLHVITVFEPAWSMGGSVRAAVDMTRGLVAQGHHVDVFTTTMATSLEAGAHWAPQAGVTARYFRVRGPSALAWSPRMAAALSSEAASYDVVHVHGVWTYPSVTAARAARAAGVPYVVTAHGALDPWVLAQRPWRKRVHLWLVGRRMLRDAGAIHCTTEAERAKLAPLGLPLRTTVIPYPLPGDAVDPLPPRGEVRRAQGLDPDAPWLLMMSRVHPMKGIDLLIRALAACRGDGRRAVLSVVGPEEPPGYGDSLRAVAREAGVADRVRFHAPVYGAARYGWFQDATLFCLTSHRENFGIVVAEAAAAGTPVLISEHVDLSSWVRERRLGFVTSLEPVDIARRLDEALADRAALDDMRARARPAALRDFDGTGTTRALVECYAGLSPAKVTS